MICWPKPAVLHKGVLYGEKEDQLLEVRQTPSDLFHPGSLFDVTGNRWWGWASCMDGDHLH
jgi:hypothetical protein